MTYPSGACEITHGIMSRRHEHTRCMQQHWMSSGTAMQACDAHGNRRCTGGDRFSLEIRGVAADAVQVKLRHHMRQGFCIQP